MKERDEQMMKMVQKSLGKIHYFIDIKSDNNSNLCDKLRMV